MREEEDRILEEPEQELDSTQSVDSGKLLCCCPSVWMIFSG
jgi:hypothetical protein